MTLWAKLCVHLGDVSKVWLRKDATECDLSWECISPYCRRSTACRTQLCVQMDVCVDVCVDVCMCVYVCVRICAGLLLQPRLTSEPARLRGCVCHKAKCWELFRHHRRLTLNFWTLHALRSFQGNWDFEGTAFYCTHNKIKHSPHINHRGFSVGEESLYACTNYT